KNPQYLINKIVDSLPSIVETLINKQQLFFVIEEFLLLVFLLN
ncbi:hypothetical protein SAMN04488086_1331, partial [Trichococcus pasteurii]